MDKKPVLRYAPSPTGPQHVGGLRTALYCYLLARKWNGEFILRIEDTDQGRFVPGSEEFIIKACAWLGITFTQGVHIGGPHAPYRQSERSEIYKEYVDKLLAAGKAYIAFDKEEDLDAARKKMEAAGAEHFTYNYVTRLSMQNSLTLPAEEVKRRIDAGESHVVRFKVPEKEEIRFQDEIRGWVHFQGSHIDDKVLLKSDGLPTYHLANVVDDRLMEVTHVVRGDEWLPSAPLHVLLYRAFGWEAEMPKFAHLPLLHDPRGRKLSKRNADEFGIPVFAYNWFDEPSGQIWEGYADLGYLPEAVLSYIALLGWHPGGEQELLSIDELVAQFSLERCHHAPARFDIEKLNSFQEHYIRTKSEVELAALAMPFAEQENVSIPSDAYLQGACKLMRERVRFAYQVLRDGRYLFEAPLSYDPTMVAKQWKGDAPQLLAGFADELTALEEWNASSVHDSFHAYAQSKGVGLGKVMAPLRLALTGAPNGPGCFEIAELIGKEETIGRIGSAILELGTAVAG